MRPNAIIPMVENSYLLIAHIKPGINLCDSQFQHQDQLFINHSFGSDLVVCTKLEEGTIYK